MSLLRADTYFFYTMSGLSGWSILLVLPGPMPCLRSITSSGLIGFAVAPLIISDLKYPSCFMLRPLGLVLRYLAASTKNL